MATNFPTSIDTNPGDPTPSETLAAGGHANLHSFVQDAMIAVQTYIGVTSSAVTSTLTYMINHLSPAQGGTGLFTYTKGDVLVALNATTIARLPVGTSGQVLTANPAATNGVDWETNPIVPTGSMLEYGGSSAPSGWLLADGSAVSRSTFSNLFAIISTVYGAGDGSTTFNVPDTRSRIGVGKGTGTKVATFVSQTSNVITAMGLTNAGNNEFQTGTSVNYITTSSPIGGLTNSTVYYVIRVTNSTFSLATSLANAQNGVVITLTSSGSGTQTFTETFSARALGDTGGEENHAESSVEQLLHSHPLTAPNTGSGGVGFGNVTTGSATLSTNSVGGNTAMNNMQPFYVATKIIKT